MQTVQAEVNAFSNMTTKAAITPAEVLEYSWFDQVVGTRQLPMDQLLAGARGRKRRGW